MSLKPLFLGTALALSIPGAALAVGSGHEIHSAGRAMAANAWMEGSLAVARASLRLTPQQEALWPAVESALRKRAPACPGGP
jgi:hypothetical protein